MFVVKLFLMHIKIKSIEDVNCNKRQIIEWIEQPLELNKIKKRIKNGLPSFLFPAAPDHLGH